MKPFAIVITALLAVLAGLGITKLIIDHTDKNSLPDWAE